MNISEQQLRKELDDRPWKAAGKMVRLTRQLQEQLVGNDRPEGAIAINWTGLEFDL